LNRKPFRQNYNIWVIIEVKWHLILNLCLIANKTLILLFEIWSGFRVVFVGFLMNVLHVLYFSCVWSVLIKNLKFFFFYVFLMLDLFWSWVFVLVCFRVNSIGSTQSGQLSRVKTMSVFKPCLVCCYFCYDIWFKDVFGKYTLNLFWIVFISRNSFFQMTSYKNTKTYNK
jgi:hypothetical protein